MENTIDGVKKINIDDLLGIEDERVYCNCGRAKIDPGKYQCHHCNEEYYDRI